MRHPGKSVTRIAIIGSVADSESYDPAGATQGLGLQWWSGDYYSGQVFSEFKIFQAFYISIYNDIYIRANIYHTYEYHLSSGTPQEFVQNLSSPGQDSRPMGLDLEQIAMQQICVLPVCMYVCI